jgi:hypothetical protein
MLQPQGIQEINASLGHRLATFSSPQHGGFLRLEHQATILIP